MSGGVDSSTAAALLNEKGFEVVGLSMQLWDYSRSETSDDVSWESKKSGTCCSLDDIYDARRVAHFLDIPFYVVNFEKAFEKEVVRPFVESYLKGETPIPCTRCNTFMKFDRLLTRANQIGAQYLATGHYARIRQNMTTGRFELLRAVDHSKDQSFFLFDLTQSQLSKIQFPLGEFTKSQIREMAETYGLPVSKKPESQEICFIPSKDTGNFVERYVSHCESKEHSKTPDTSSHKKGLPTVTGGSIVDKKGDVLGKHSGIHHFTVGQRRGLGIATGERLYVIETDKIKNQVVIGQDNDLLSKGLVATKINWISIPSLTRPKQVKAQIRNRHQAADATIFPKKSGSVLVHFNNPQRAITPGQAVVFYQDDLVIGGGWIKKSL